MQATQVFGCAAGFDHAPGHTLISFVLSGTGQGEGRDELESQTLVHLSSVWRWSARSAGVVTLISDWVHHPPAVAVLGRDFPRSQRTGDVHVCEHAHHLPLTSPAITRLSLPEEWIGPIRLL